MPVYMPAARARRRRKALVAVQIVIVLPVLLGFAALSVDIGVMYNAKAELQRTADASVRGAAALLNEYGTLEDPLDAPEIARAEAVRLAALNPVCGQPMVLSEGDVVFGRSFYDSSNNSYTFTPDLTYPNAVRVTVRKTSDSPNGAIPLFFAGIFGKSFKEMAATATAVLVPRDIVIVADLSGSTSYDSQLRHYDIDTIEINPFDVWAGFSVDAGKGGIINGVDPPAPGAPTAMDNQPCNGPGVPGHASGNPDPDAQPWDGVGDTGPRWGWMTGQGGRLYPKPTYSPGTDEGLYKIQRYQTTTDPDVIQNLTESGYSPAEITALCSPAYDNNSTYYYNRVKAMLGLAGWKSKKSGGKYSGYSGGGNRVDSSELVQKVAYPFPSGSWNDYFYYVRRSSSSMNTSDANFQYQFGIKTFVDYLLVRRRTHAQTPELAETPAQPLHAIKEAVDRMVTQIGDFQTSDQLALAVYATDSNLEVELGLVFDSETGFHDTTVAERLHAMQAAHYNVYTNIDAGLEEAIQELTGPRARPEARKVIVVLTDGRANRYTDDSGRIRSGTTASKQAARGTAQLAADQRIQIYSVSVGGDADTALMEEIAEIGDGEWMHAAGSIEEYSEQLDLIFKRLSGGSRPVEMIN